MIEDLLHIQTFYNDGFFKRQQMDKIKLFIFLRLVCDRKQRLGKSFKFDIWGLFTTPTYCCKCHSICLALFPIDVIICQSPDCTFMAENIEEWNYFREISRKFSNINSSVWLFNFSCNIDGSHILFFEQMAYKIC